MVRAGPPNWKPLDDLFVLLPILTALALLALVEAVYSLWSGHLWGRSFGSNRPDGNPPDAPRAAVILPCRGCDPLLEANLQALVSQEAGDYELLAVVDSADDPAVELIERVARQKPERVRLRVAGRARSRGQKVHNLLFALDQLRPADEVLAWVDSDVVVSSRWLADLTAPLGDPVVGVSSGFRWYVPPEGAGFAAMLRSLWNAGGASLMVPGRSPFAWGGSMAMRREDFERCRVREAWQGAVSDDYALAGAVRGCGLAIHFEPRCLVPTREDCTWTELTRWVFRQLLITRVYAPRLWRLAVAAHLLSSAVFWGGVAVAAAILLTGTVPEGGVAFMVLAAAVYLLGALKSGLRLRAVATVIPAPGGSWKGVATHWFAGPLSSLLSLQGLVRSAFTREMTWRGIRYRLVSASETIVLDDRPAEGG